MFSAPLAGRRWPRRIPERARSESQASRLPPGYSTSAHGNREPGLAKEDGSPGSIESQRLFDDWPGQGPRH